MKDEELIGRLRQTGERINIPCPDGIKGCLVFHFRVETDPTCAAAADRIEELVKQQELLVAQRNAAWERDTYSENAWKETEAKLAKAIDALRLVTDACDEGQMVSLGTSGMTIDAQIRRSVYNKVPAWPIEEARVVLEELDNK
jgi:hypothetical protein